MELKPYSEAAGGSDTQEFPHILLNQKFHNRVHKSPLLAPILSQMNPVCPVPYYLSKIHLSTVLFSHLLLGPRGSVVG
jgi:hypothetical protein